MRHWKTVLLSFILCISVVGCHTLQGAKEGFKQDWKDWKKTDGWIQKNLW